MHWKGIFIHKSYIEVHTFSLFCSKVKVESASTLPLMKIQGFFFRFYFCLCKNFTSEARNLKQLDKDILILSYTKILTFTSWYV